MICTSGSSSLAGRRRFSVASRYSVTWPIPAWSHQPSTSLIFAAPTRFYKTGIVFLAWLNGHQDHFTMVGGQESARSVLHLTDIFRLADRARLFSDPGLAADRMRKFLAVHGVA